MIDWDRVSVLREEVGVDDFGEVVDLFLQEVDEELDHLAGLTDARQIAEKLHFLKGSAQSLGFREFSGMCQNGETLLHRDPQGFVDIEALIQSYRNARQMFVQDLPLRFAP